MRADSYYPGMKGQSVKWYPDDLVIAPPTAGKYIFADGNQTSSGAGNSWEDSYSTIQAAVDSAARGSQIMVAPVATNGYYSENVIIGDGTSATEYALEGLHLMGVTNALKNVRIKASAGTTLRPYGSLAGVSVAGVCLSVCCSGIEVSNLAFDAASTYDGVYWGDGGRFTTGAYTGQSDAQNGYIHNCTFMYGYSGIYYDGCSNDQLCENNLFYKQADQGIYIGPGALQHSSRVRVRNNEFNGCENYGVYIYSTANTKDIMIGPFNVFKDQLHGTTAMTASVYSLSDTPTNAVFGNWHATTTMMDLGTHDIASGNFRGKDGATEEYVAED